MASISTSTAGLVTIYFVGADDKRKKIPLGRVPKRDAQAFKLRVEELVTASITNGTLSRETAIWLRDLADKQHAKLARVGLVEARGVCTLGKLIETFLASHTCKATTRQTITRAGKHLTDHFGEERDLRKITPGDAKDWHGYLTNTRKPCLATATIGRSIRYAKQFMRYAIDKGYIDADPFRRLSGNNHTDASKAYFLELEDFQRIIDVMPCPQWRLLFALARLGGLRIPSEALALRWEDVIWDQNRMIVHASKTEHHAGGGVRVVPIFGDLRPFLLAAFEAADDGDEYVITRYRDPAANLRTQLQRYIKQAGLVPWPKLWQNLRASRATELDARYPSKDVNAWMGHCEKVAMHNYRQTRDASIEQAAELVMMPSKAVQKVVQNVVQTVHDTPRHEATPADKRLTQTLAVSYVGNQGQKKAASCNHLQNAADGPGRIRTCDLTLIRGAL